MRGIYMQIKKNMLVYLGEAKNLAKRDTGEIMKKDVR